MITTLDARKRANRNAESVLDDPFLAIQFLLKRAKGKVNTVAKQVNCHRATIYRMINGSHEPSRLVRSEIIRVAKRAKKNDLRKRR